MEIIVEAGRIRFGEDSLLCTGGHIGWSWSTPSSNGESLRDLLGLWAEALESVGDKTATLYLPYQFEDETIECFEATCSDSQVVLRCLVIRAAGTGYTAERVREFMRSLPGPVVERCPEPFGAYPRIELAAALRHPRVSD